MELVWLGIVLVVCLKLLYDERERFKRSYVKPPPITFPVQAEFWMNSSGSMVLAHESDNHNDWIEAGYRLVTMTEV